MLCSFNKLLLMDFPIVDLFIIQPFLLIVKKYFPITPKGAAFYISPFGFYPMSHLMMPIPAMRQIVLNTNCPPVSSPSGPSSMSSTTNKMRNSTTRILAIVLNIPGWYAKKMIAPPARMIRMTVSRIDIRCSPFVLNKRL